MMAKMEPIDVNVNVRLVADPETVAALTAEVERLQGWQHGAITVLDQWETVWDQVGRPVHGGSKAESVRLLVEDLTNEVETVDARLGLATTKQLLEEVACRLEILGFSPQPEAHDAIRREVWHDARSALDLLPPWLLDYRTVDHPFKVSET